MYAARSAHQLLAAFDRAWAGHDHELAPADRLAAGVDDGVAWFEVAAGELVRPRDARHSIDAWQNFECLEQVVREARADDTDHGPFLPLRDLRFEVVQPQNLDDVLDFFGARARLHDGDHGYFTPSGFQPQTKERPFLGPLGWHDEVLWPVSVSATAASCRA